MIFKKLFRPKHQDPKPAVRIAAIDSLSGEVPEQKSILHELAFNDEDVNVSLAALSKLNSFVLWYKMSEIAKSERVLKRAQQMVENTLFGDDESVLSQQKKREFAYECKNNKLLERLIKQPWVQQEPKLVLHILSVLNKPQLALPILLASQDSDLQQALLVYADSPASLQKIIKKAPGEHIKSLAKNKLEQIEFAKTQPVALEKSTRLVLSRMLALREQRDYAKLLDTRSKLNQEYAQYSAQFDCLSADKRQEFITKFDELSSKLDILDAELAPLYHAEQKKRNLADAVQHATADTQAMQVWLSDMLAGDISSITLAQTEQAQTEIQNRTGRIENLILEADSVGMASQKAALNSLLVALQKRQHTFNHLPAFQDSLKQADALITEFAQMAVPEQAIDVQQAQHVLKEKQGQWRKLRESYQDSWPKALDKQFSALQQTWQSAIKALAVGISKEVSRIRSKAKAIEVLIEQGKYKAAIGLFAKVSKWFDALPEQEKKRNERTYEQVSSKIEELKSLQAYIAMPRKPALLEEAEALVEANLSVSLRAEQVKELRRRWNSLGVLNTPEDDALNEQFDTLIEQAFSPCREHFEKQQAQRESNLVQKQALIVEVTDLAEQSLEASELSKVVQQLQQKWQKIGDVDFTVKTELNNAYRQALAPLKKQIEAYFNENAAQKQALITQAQGLSSVDDVTQAIEQAKALQEKWKQVGQVQRKSENLLWNQFREANDAVFAKRKAHNQQQKQANDAQVSAVNGLLANMQQSINGAQSISELDETRAAEAELEAQLSALPKGLSSGLYRRLTGLSEERQAKRASLELQAKTQSFSKLFDVLKRWETPALPEEIDSLPSQWQQSFKALAQHDVPRLNLTLMLEIVSDVPSPQTDDSLRKEIQLQLMADKLQQGVEYDKASLLKRWIQHGPVAQQEQVLLTRAQRCFA
ncbi:MAG: DUF349 domain-containing protein [Paraglaciecola sp.]